MIITSETAAIVTGGASGLGAGTAHALAAAGAKVAIFDMNEEQGNALAAELGATFCLVNVMDAESVTAGFAAARAANGQERIFVNCAGGSGGGGGKTVRRDKASGAISGHSLEIFDRVVQLNLIGTFRCIVESGKGMAALDPIEDGERGVIVNTASVAAQDGQIGQVAYSAAKAGIVGMTLTIARDLASEGIRINTIMPGIMATPPMAKLPEQVLGGLAASVPFPKRLGKPEEFASAVMELVRNSYFNGQAIRLDGAIRMAPR